MSTLNLTSKIVHSKDGSEIYAEASGDPTKIPIVFVHGMACSGASFDEFWALQEIQENFHLVRSFCHLSEGSADRVSGTLVGSLRYSRPWKKRETDN